MSEGLVRDLKKRRFWLHFGRNALAFLGALAVVAGVVDVFTEDLLDGYMWLVWPALVTSVIYAFIRSWPRPVETSYESPKTTICLTSGDLFEDASAHLVIGATDTFDTAAPHISPQSIQGQFLKRVYGSDVSNLDSDIERALAGRLHEQVISGKAGKNKQYALGTVVTLKSQARRFFLVAYSAMDRRSSASSSTDGMWNSLSRLWAEVRAESNGGKVCVPVIGGGQSKLSPFLPASDSIRFIALSFMLASRQAKVCDELVIVARPEEYEKLDHLELQAFFDSLRPS